MPLTIESEELDIDYTGFTECAIKVIKETFVLFQHVSLLEYQNKFTVYLGGEMFSKPGFGYWLSNTSDKSLHVKIVGVRADGSKGDNLCGLYMNVEKKHYLVYHILHKMHEDDEI